MSDEIVKTGVDELLELLKNNNKLPLVDVAKKLGVAVDVVQAWVDFLVEERILGIEYKFTTPYIYLNKPIENLRKVYVDSGPIDLTFFKNQFWDKAKHNNIPESRIPDLWRNHLLQELELKKKYFFYEAQARKIIDTEKLWEEYQKNLLSL
ncbi:TPA: hypothetical protein ENS27_07190 [bacterium]|nr:hypothetical protein [bacterium]